MNKYQYILGGLFLLLTGLSSCSTEEKITGEVEEGNNPIRLAGILSKTTGDCGDTGSNTYDNLYLSAKVNEDGKLGVDFFKNKAFNNGLELPSYVVGNTTSKDIPLQETLYYPLGEIGLHLFAHSGKIDEAGHMSLKAGQDKANDYIISNGLDVEGMGTHSSSVNTSTTLTFRHAMTKVFVDVVVDQTDTPDPAPDSIQITLNEGMAVQTGSYSITSTGNAINGSGNYTLRKGINYLIPNGKVLADKTATIYPIKSLVIDDYTAAAADIEKLALTPATDNPHEKVELIPGYAYKITFNVKRLKVTEITFTQIDWDTVILGNENSSYVPAKLNVSLGDYLQTETKDAITKVVLHTGTTENKQYVGDVKYDGGNPAGQFVSLPANVESVDLYTNQGLLIAGVAPDAGTYQDDATTPDTSDKKITISLSKGGMRTLNGGTHSSTNPYLVETPLQFMNISKDAGGNIYYQQKNDIDFESLNTAFIPVGTFNGTYDGNSKRILNAAFTGNGLFSTNSGTIKNIRIASGKITATGTHAGSICGVNAGTVVGCINEAQIHGSATHAGGICGENNGKIIACLNTGDIFAGSEYSGGICGENKSTASGAITACVNVGMMNRNSVNMAGICGTTVSGTGLFKTCYWLTGTAKRYSGNDVGVNDTEEAVKGYTPAISDDVADLSPQKLRDEHDSEENVTTTVILSTACSGTDYKFTYDVQTNGCVWPMPVKK